MIFERRLDRDNLPILRVVNRRCEEYGLREFRNRSRLLHEWREYLVAAARAREAEIRERRGSDRAEDAERHPPSGHPDPERPVEHRGQREEPDDRADDDRARRSRTPRRRNEEEA